MQNDKEWKVKNYKIIMKKMIIKQRLVFDNIHVQTK